MSDATTVTDVAGDETPVKDRLTTADEIVRSHVKWAAAGGLVPVPGLDMAAIAAVQLRMLNRLAQVYGVPFKDNLGKELIGTLVASGLPYNAAAGTAVTFGAFIRLVPVVGQLLGLAILPAFAAASTFALGRVFTKHFESGGTFLDFDVTSGKAEFQTELEKAKTELKTAEAEAAAATARASAAPVVKPPRPATT